MRSKKKDVNLFDVSDYIISLEDLPEIDLELDNFFLNLHIDQELKDLNLDDIELNFNNIKEKVK